MTDTVPPDGGERPEAPMRPEVQEPSAAALVFDDPLGRSALDDTDEGWGERPTSGGGASDLARFLDEKPPHHI